MMLLNCCTQYARKFGKFAVATVLEKVSFHSNPKDRKPMSLPIQLEIGKSQEFKGLANLILTSRLMVLFFCVKVRNPHADTRSPSLFVILFIIYLHVLIL